MCEYCNINDIDKAKAIEFLRRYNAMDEGSVILVDNVLESMLSIYKDTKSAGCAVRRIEYRNVRVTPSGELGVIASDVVSELEALLYCRGNTGNLLDG